MTKIRVLVTDDSVVQRCIICDAIDGHDEIEVIDTAVDGIDCLEKLAALDPDVLVLDLEMPRMGGLEALELIRKRKPHLPVLIYSSLTTEGAKATIDALSRGASDYAHKPSGSGSHSSSGASQHLCGDLIPKILALGGSYRAAASRSQTPVVAAPRISRRAAKPRILAIGSSTGGPQALFKVVSRLAPGFPIPIVITQHMPPHYTHALAERLSTVSPVPIVEAEDGMKIEPGRGYVAPGDFHMLITRNGRVRLDQSDLGTYHRPAVDPMFESLVSIVGGSLLAVVLTGMGADGTKGAKAIRDAGGTVIVQDERTSVVWGMPGSIAKAGLADAILPIDDIADAINQRVTVLARL